MFNFGDDPPLNVDSKKTGFVYTTSAGQRFLKSKKTGFMRGDAAKLTANCGNITWTDFDKTLISWHGDHRYATPSDTSNIFKGDKPLLTGSITSFNFGIIAGAAYKNKLLVIFSVRYSDLTCYFIKNGAIVGISTIGQTYRQLFQSVVISPDCTKASFIVFDWYKNGWHPNDREVTVIDLTLDLTAYTAVISSAVIQDSSWYFTYPSGDYINYHRDLRTLVVAVDYDKHGTRLELLVGTAIKLTMTNSGTADPDWQPALEFVTYPFPEGWYDVVSVGTFTQTIVSSSTMEKETYVTHDGVTVSRIYQKTTTNATVVNSGAVERGGFYNSWSRTTRITWNPVVKSISSTVIADEWKCTLINELDLRYGIKLTTEIVRNGGAGSTSYSVTDIVKVGSYTASNFTTSSFPFDSHFLKEIQGLTKIEFGVKVVSCVFDLSIANSSSPQAVVSSNYSDMRQGLSVTDIYSNHLVQYQSISGYTANNYTHNPEVVLKVDVNGTRYTNAISTLNGVI